MQLIHKAAIAAALSIAIAFPALADDDSSALFADAAPAASSQAAGGTAAAASPASAGGDFYLGLSGNHEFGYHFPAYDSDNYNYGSAMKAPYFSNEFGLAVQDKDLKLVSNWDANLKPFATDSTSEYGSYVGSLNKLLTIAPEENYVSWSPKGLKLSAGYQTFSWGVADKKNPTDNLNPRDYSLGVNADKIPVLSADAVFYPTDQISIEGVFLPAAQDSVYPVDFEDEVDAGAATLSQALSYALSAKYSAIASATYHRPMRVSYSVASSPATRSKPAFEPENSIVGGKLNYHSSAFDASVSYLYDIDPLYTPIIAVTTDSSNPLAPTSKVSISLERERIHRFGADVKTTLGKFGLWTEACYSLTRNSGASEDYEYRRSKLDYVLGTDLSFGPNDAIYANLQYFGTWVPGYDDSYYSDLATGSIASIEEAYQRALVETAGLETEGLLQGVTANLKWELLDGTITPQVTAVFAMPFQYDDANEKRYGSLALNPEIDLKPVDSFHIKLGADLAYAWVKPSGGDPKLDTSADKIGIYTPSNNVYLKILYKWNYDLKK